MGLLRALKEAEIVMRTGLDPSSHGFFCHPEDRPKIEAALADHGVHEDEFELFKISESRHFEPGEVIVFDRRQAEENPLFRPTFDHDPVLEAMKKNVSEALRKAVGGFPWPKQG